MAEYRIDEAMQALGSYVEQIATDEQYAQWQELYDAADAEVAKMVRLCEENDIFVR